MLASPSHCHCHCLRLSMSFVVSHILLTKFSPLPNICSSSPMFVNIRLSNPFNRTAPMLIASNPFLDVSNPFLDVSSKYMYDTPMIHDTCYMMTIYTVEHISNLYADPDARSMNLSRITRRNTRSVLSSPGRSFFYVLCFMFYVLGCKKSSPYPLPLKTNPSPAPLIYAYSSPLKRREDNAHLPWHRQPMFTPPTSHPWQYFAPENSLLCT